MTAHIANIDLQFVQDCALVDVVADQLDLSPYCSAAAGQPLYKLAGVTNHSGSMQRGHYKAQCRSPVDGGWHTCNDSLVLPSGTVDGLSSEAYMLLYRRQDC